MQDQAHDQIGYRIAVATIGIALIVALAGLCVIVAVGQGTEIPKELWTTVGALGGGLLGLLAPSPTATAPKVGEEKAAPEAPSPLLEAARMNRSVVILLTIFGLAVVVGAISDSTQFQALAGASGAALIGLLAPSPTAKQS